jgi:hypothetical protein
LGLLLPTKADPGLLSDIGINAFDFLPFLDFLDFLKGIPGFALFLNVMG